MLKLDADATWDQLAHRAAHADRINTLMKDVLTRFKEHIEFLASRDFSATFAAPVSSSDKAIISFPGVAIRVVQQVWADANSAFGALHFYVVPPMPDLFKAKLVATLEVNTGGLHALKSGGQDFDVGRNSNMIAILLQILSDAQEVRFFEQ